MTSTVKSSPLTNALPADYVRMLRAKAQGQHYFIRMRTCEESKDELIQARNDFYTKMREAVTKATHEMVTQDTSRVKFKFDFDRCGTANFSCRRFAFPSPEWRAQINAR